MDAIDQKIIAELQRDGRLTNQELSERVGLSPSPCLRRVRNLEKAGVIKGYNANIDQERYGLPINVFVSIRLERQTDAALKAFERGVEGLDEVMECYLMTGSRDYLLRVVSDSLKSYERFVREVLSALPGIASIESSFAFSQLKQRAALPPLSHFSRS
ncbi:MAG: Lrp/AsnC family transcriptional regulator [Paracoccaceae bacterium]|nr:Lrp/AsnC family transcriptional regulator [Paracoccaceae bacterium]